MNSTELSITIGVTHWLSPQALAINSPFFLQKFTPFWFRHTFKIEGAMFASIAATEAFFKVIFFSKHHIAKLVVVEINMLNQRVVHSVVVLKVRLWPLEKSCPA